MIVEWLASTASWISAFVATLFPQWEPPSWFVDFGGQFQAVLDGADGLGVWLPFGVMTAVLGAVLTTYVVCFTIKLILRVGSHVPQFGGAG